MSLAIDPSGEVVCAGAMDPFEIYVWNLQTGRLLDILPGHLGPVSGMAFTGAQSLLASSSWDKTVRMWDPFTGKGLVETFTHGSDVLALAFRPDGRELCSAALDGQLYFWDTYDGTLKSNIEGKKDILGGRRQDDPRAAKNSTHSTAFTSVCYSADGTCVLAGGNSKFVCIYEIASKILIKKFVITNNLSMDGVLNFLNSRNMTEAGASHEIDDEASGSDVEDRLDHYLPGAKRGDFSSRRTPLVARYVGLCSFTD
jgi:periodic tryptophan protein 2